jgi:hypothetical protein
MEVSLLDSKHVTISTVSPYKPASGHCPEQAQSREHLENLYILQINFNFILSIMYSTEKY